jgi:hypothetical protein
MTYRHTTDGKRDDSLAVTMDHTVNIGIAFVKLAVDESLDVSLRRFLIHRVGIFDIIFFDVLST